MAKRINTVYRTVLAVLNKEQRGFLTPEQFNKFAKMAQTEVLEDLFFEYNREIKKENILGHYDEFNIADKIREKLDLLVKEEVINLDSDGHATLPASADKILHVTVHSDSSYREKEVEKISRAELAEYKSSKLSAPSADYPVYYQRNSLLEIFPANNTDVTEILLDYIAVPADPTWAFTGGGSSSYTYDDGNSVDFELPQSEDPKIIRKILMYAGLVVKDPNIIQVAQAEESSQFNKENV